MWVSPDCTHVCRCDEGSVHCEPYMCHPDAECSVRNGVRDCYCKHGYRGDGIQDCTPGM